MPSTLRIELERLGFDFKEGQMIHQWGTGYQQPKPPTVVDNKDPLLDERWHNGAGHVDVPRFMAADSKAVYIPYKDLHGSGLRRIMHEPADYMDCSEPIPYPDV